MKKKKMRVKSPLTSGAIALTIALVIGFGIATYEAFVPVFSLKANETAIMEETVSHYWFWATKTFTYVTGPIYQSQPSKEKKFFLIKPTVASFKIVVEAKTGWDFGLLSSTPQPLLIEGSIDLRMFSAESFNLLLERTKSLEILQPVGEKLKEAFQEKVFNCQEPAILAEHVNNAIQSGLLQAFSIQKADVKVFSVVQIKDKSLLKKAVFPVSEANLLIELSGGSRFSLEVFWQNILAGCAIGLLVGLFVLLLPAAGQISWDPDFDVDIDIDL